MDSQAVQETVRVFTVYVGRERLRLSTLFFLPGSLAAHMRLACGSSRPHICKAVNNVGRVGVSYNSRQARSGA